MNFSSFDLRPELQKGIADLGFKTPTPVQQKAIPPGLEGRDVLACAMTGSGKTAAFLLPVLQRLLRGGKRRGTRALVLAPTRELAAQIVEQANDLARHTPLRAAAIYGGVGMKPQERALRDGVDLIVACPGRLLDHFQYPYASMRQLEMLVLDEADRMLDMGFLPDIRRILRHLPDVSQTMLFSATMPKPIVQLSRTLLERPATLDIERPSAPAKGVEQSIYPVPAELKTALLIELIRRNEIDNALVFTRTKHRANRVAEKLNKVGIDAERVHGNRSQAQRDKALSGFREGRYRILVATDVAARGIDIQALSHVVNFDVPNLAEDYIHRVGRTARAGLTGEALTFVSPKEKNDLRAIENKVGRVLPRRRLEDFDYDAAPTEKLEIPIRDRIAEIRARKAADRARSKAKAERKAQAEKDSGRGSRRDDGGGRGRRRRPGKNEAKAGGGRGPGKNNSGRGSGPSEAKAGGRGPGKNSGGRGPGKSGGGRSNSAGGRGPNGRGSGGGRSRSGRSRGGRSQV